MTSTANAVVAAGEEPQRRRSRKTSKSNEIILGKVTLSKRIQVRQELERLAEDHRNRLSPRDVVEAARNEISPLHELFTWDDSIAAERFRLLEAGALIRRIRVTIIQRKVKTKRIHLKNIRVFQSPQEDRSEGGRSYVHSSVIADLPKLKQSLIRTVLLELEAIKNRHKEIEALDVVWKAIESKLIEIR